MRSFNLGLALLLCACGSSNGAGAPSSAGASGTPGGSSGGSGAASASGGSTATGGTPASVGGNGGGMAATGGAAHAGSGGSSQIGAGGMVTAVGCPKSQAPGTWLNVTDPAMKMTGDFVNGPLTVNVDPAKPSDVYVHVQHDGTWKSTDCGMTYKKVSTGLNADQQNTGSQWGAVIDPNPKRDPATPPTIYVNQGYGALGLWKSTDGGVNWTNVFNGNIYASDGVTNISRIVGTDTAAPFMLSSDNADHLVIFMHGCWNCGANDGIFETTDGGGKWALHPTPNFNFQPHSDLLSAINAKTWWVDHGYPATFWRSTDAGATWVQSTGSVDNGMGHSIARVGTTGTTYYTGSDYRDGVFKTTDDGASWSHTAAPGNQVSWVATTATHVYASNAFTANPHILVASLADDTKWVDQGNPQGMVENGANNPGVLFDGEHYVIIAAQARGGAWRYVEP